MKSKVDDVRCCPDIGAVTLTKEGTTTNLPIPAPGTRGVYAQVVGGEFLPDTMSAQTAWMQMGVETEIIINDREHTVTIMLK